jgi:omega-amidase
MAEHVTLQWLSGLVQGQHRMTLKITSIVLTLAALPMAGADAGVKLKVAAVQFRSSFDVRQNSERIAVDLRRLAGDGVQVAVFPECALTGYDTRPAFAPSAVEIENAEKQLQRTCRDAKIAAVIGSVYKVNGRAYDAAVVFDSHGVLVERYGKVYLAGEEWATPGNHVAYFELEGVLSTVIICHDERYPELVRLPALKGARIIYYISSESGMREEHKLLPYRAQVMARAVENGMFLVQANAPANPDLSGSHGQSRIIASDGNVLKEASFFDEEILVGTLAIQTGNLQRPLEGLLGQWWSQGLDSMMNNRRRQLD